MGGLTDKPTSVDVQPQSPDQSLAIENSSAVKPCKKAANEHLKRGWVMTFINWVSEPPQGGICCALGSKDICPEHSRVKFSIGAEGKG